MLYAFLGNSVPIFGQTRKPYMFIGAFICSTSWILLGVLHKPNKYCTTVLMFVSYFGLVMSVVNCDALVAFKVKIENTDELGNTQSSTW